MRLLLFCLLPLLTACSGQGVDKTAINQQPPEKGTATAINVPVQVQEYINTHLPGWNMINKQDYAESFWSFYDRSILPFFTAVDLNDDGIVDYGVLVKKQGFVQLVVLLGEGDSFKHWMAGNFKKAFTDMVNDLNYCLTPEPPGQVDVTFPTIRSLILASNAINLMYMENRFCIYYWDGQKIAVFQTMQEVDNKK